MRVYRLVVAAVLLVVGLVWLGQGSGMIGGSAMSGSSFWAIAGAILVIGALAAAWLEYRRASGGGPSVGSGSR